MEENLFFNPSGWIGDTGRYNLDVIHNVSNHVSMWYLAQGIKTNIKTSKQNVFTRLFSCSDIFRLGFVIIFVVLDAL